jgi:4-hydroxy-2-oxoheptanedioate aldolase
MENSDQAGNVIRSEDLRSGAREGRIFLNAWCALPSATTAEIMALQGWDFVSVDLQHGLLDYQAALEMIRVIQGHGKTPLARIPWLEPAIPMKLLDAGVKGLICPLVSSSAQAERFVSICSYPPTGIRSFGPTRAALLDANHFSWANEQLIKIVQIEEASAVEAVEEIAAVKGVDVLYVGPSDLSLSYGHPPRLDPDYPPVWRAYERVIEACRANDVVPAIHCLTPDYASKMAALGFRLITVSSDLRLLTGAGNDLVRRCRELTGSGGAPAKGSGAGY